MIKRNPPIDKIDDFNLNDEYGSLLDFLDTYVSEMESSVKHFGVKGMKWGVRKEQPTKNREPIKSLGPDSVTRKTKNGEIITLQKVPPSKLQNFLGRHSKNFREEYSKQASLRILDSSGKRVGDAMVQKRSKDELYLEWLGIDKSERGKGYASAVMKAGRDFGKQEGFKKMVLEVPGNSPDARHIYENLGFKYVGEVDGGFKDPIWGGLSKMEYDFDSVEHGSISHYGALSGSAIRKKDRAKLDEMVHEYQKMPEKVIAERMTRGEKAVAHLISESLSAGTFTASRRIENKQAKGAYN